MRLSTVLVAVLALIVALCFVTWLAGSSRTSSVTEKPNVIPGEVQKDAHGNYVTNPFTPPSQPPFPKAEAPETSFSFGRMPQGQESRHAFVINNVGEGPLKVALGPSTCKCTLGKLAAEDVPPGGSTEVEMVWTPESSQPMFSQSATVWTSDPVTPSLSLTIEGDVFPRVMTSPEGIWTIGIIKEEGPTQFSGKVVSVFEDEFQIVSVKPSSDLIRVSTRPLSAEELQEMPGSKSGHALECELEPAMPVGPFQESISVETDIPEVSVLTFAVSGNRLGPFQIIAPEWFPTKSLLRMGRFPAAQGKKISLSLFVEKRDEPLELTRFNSEPDILTVSFAKDEKFETAARERYLVTIEAPAGITPGRWQSETAVKLQLHLSDPENDLLRFNVELQAD